MENYKYNFSNNFRYRDQFSLISMPIINILAVYYKHIFCMTIFHIPKPTQYLN